MTTYEHIIRPVGWTNHVNGTRYTRNVPFTVAMDNYEPVPRRIASGVLEEWTKTDGSIVYRLVDWQGERDAVNAVYLIDNGRTVTPYYVAGQTNVNHGDRILLHPFPTNYAPDGTRKTRADNGEPVDHGTWRHGPRRAYHLKIAEA